MFLMSWYHYYNYYPQTKRRTAKGGIKAQSKRGGFGQSWWAKRWIEVLESFNIGARLGRGRSYARNGQVLSIDIAKGLVTAGVQGSMPSPYQIKIKVKTLSEKAWDQLAKVLSRQAIFAAKLLAGEMPENIEDTFKEAGLSLFPEKQGDLTTDCSCPDWSNPCKHIAAVYYLLGEEFDRDPFLIFKLRGMEREELVRLVGVKPAQTNNKERKKAKSANAMDRKEESPVSSESIPAEPQIFWGRIDVKDNLAFDEVSVPAISAALPKRLGKFPFWRGEENFLTSLEEIYREASPVGMDVFLGEMTVAEKG
jgi:uncharacterized Zn finger protein